MKFIRGNIYKGKEGIHREERLELVEDLGLFLRLSPYGVVRKYKFYRIDFWNQTLEMYPTIELYEDEVISFS